MHMQRPYLGYRKIFNFNQNWQFSRLSKEFDLGNFNEQSWDAITLPHSNVILPHSDFAVSSYQFHSLYRKTFNIGEKYIGNRIHLTFDGAMTVAEVYINQQKVGTHKGGYTSFILDITEFVIFGHDNEVLVHLDSTSHADIPPEGNEVDYLLFGGIYRSVFLAVVSPLRIDDIYLYTEQLTDTIARVKGELILRNDTDHGKDATVELRLESRSGNLHHLSLPSLHVPARGQASMMIDMAIADPKPWSLEDPHLYQVRVVMHSTDAAVYRDDVQFDFGIRTISVQAGYLLVNSQRVKLLGLNRHQMFPYIGNAAPKRVQRKDAEILKNELGVNYVRTSHYPQDPAFLDACDELGLLVFTELPGWQHIGDSEWQKLALEHLHDMIMRDRNHTCVFMWGVRINESPDNHDFYHKSNALAKALDPHRLTGGVRNFRDSEWLEDVFTYNDVSMGVLPTAHSPQLVTEFAGHMYPAKSSDEENRLLKHALYHAGIINEVLGREDIIGASGWCAFDYNTDSNFGSGSNVCFHGVMDMFRKPKFAGHFYKSQLSPDQQLVLEFASYVVHGSPEHTEIIAQDNVHKEFYPKDLVAPLILFSNCDEVELFVNGESLGRRTPLFEEYPHLVHPPFRFEQRPYKFVGEYRAIGYRDGKSVIIKELQTPKGVTQLELIIDHEQLDADGSDMTQLTVFGLDQNGTFTPYANRVIQFQITGPGELVGENPVALEGGRIAVFVKSKYTPGIIQVTAHAQGLNAQSVTVRVVPANDPVI